MSKIEFTARVAPQLRGLFRPGRKEEPPGVARRDAAGNGTAGLTARPAMRIRGERWGAPAAAKSCLDSERDGLSCYVYRYPHCTRMPSIVSMGRDRGVWKTKDHYARKA